MEKIIEPVQPAIAFAPIWLETALVEQSYEPDFSNDESSSVEDPEVFPLGIL